MLGSLESGLLMSPLRWGHRGLLSETRSHKGDKITLGNMDF